MSKQTKTKKATKTPRVAMVSVARVARVAMVSVAKQLVDEGKAVDLTTVARWVTAQGFKTKKAYSNDSGRVVNTLSEKDADKIKSHYAVADMGSAVPITALAVQVKRDVSGVRKRIKALELKVLTRTTGSRPVNCLSAKDAKFFIKEVAIPVLN